MKQLVNLKLITFLDSYMIVFLSGCMIFSEQCSIFFNVISIFKKKKLNLVSSKFTNRC